MSVWNTQRVEELLKKYNEDGVMPRDNPFYMGDQELRKPDLVFEYTEEEMLELSKIAKSVLYFGEKYAKVITDSGIREVKLREYQKKVLMQYQKFRYNVYLASRQCGKSIGMETKLVTNNGYKYAFEIYYENKTGRNLFDKIRYGLYKILIKC